MNAHALKSKVGPVFSDIRGLEADGSVVTWGSPQCGGDSSAVEAAKGATQDPK